MVILRSGRSPFEIFMLAACVLAGIAGLITPRASSNAISMLLPDWQLIAWYWGLVVSGSIGLLGIAGKRATALLVERIGLATLSCLTLAYSIAVVDAAGLRGAFAAGITAAFAVACVGRCWQIGADLKLVSRGAVEGRATRERRRS